MTKDGMKSRLLCYVLCGNSFKAAFFACTKKVRGKANAQKNAWLLFAKQI